MEANLPPTAKKKVVHFLVHRSKLNETAAFTFKVIEHRRQGLEIHPALLVGTMIDILEMCRAVQVLIQTRRFAKLFMAEVALVVLSIPGISSRPAYFVPSDGFLGDDAV